MKRGLFDLLASQRRFIYLMTALLSAGGIWAALRIPSAIYPELVFPRVIVVAEGSSLDARQMVFSVTRPIEEAVSVVPGVTRVQSRSIRGSTQITITFSQSTEMIQALQLVQARVQQVAGQLPSDMQIEVERMTPSLFPIVSYNLEGGEPAALYDIARYQIKPLISRVPGVGRVDVQGSDVREIEVIADPARLAGEGLTYDDVARAITEATTVNTVGRVSRDYKQYLIVTAQEPHSVDDIANVVIGHGVRVGDVAKVEVGTIDHVSIIAGDGKPAALLNITRQPGGNTVALADSVARIAANIAHTLPPGVKLKAVYDQSALVRDAVKSVRDAMLIGAFLAVIVLLIFLQHARITAISASSIPLTLAITVLVMYLIGQTFNLMTLGAMAIAIGLVIDDAVVITENIVRHLHLNPDRVAAVREAVQEIIWPVTTSTITTVVVFLPLRLLEGVTGQFFAALSITLTIAVMVSLVLALTVIPLLAAQYLRPEDADDPDVVSVERHAKQNKFQRLLERVGSAIDTISERYEQSLNKMLNRLRWALIAAGVMAIIGLVAKHYVGSGFLPEVDESAFVLDYWAPGGTALAETNRQVNVVEKILAKTPEITGTSRRTGAELGLFATEQNRGDIAARLKPQGERSRSIFEVMDEVRQKVEESVPRLRVEFVEILSDVINDLAGGARPVEVKIFGSDLNAIEAYAKKLEPQMDSIAGIEDFFSGVSEPSAQLSMSISQSEANRLGITPEDVATKASAALLGAPAGEIKLDDRAVGVRVRAPDSVRYDASQLAALPIVSQPGKTPTPLGALATFTPLETRSELLRENQQQMIAMTADVSGRSLGSVVDDVKNVLAKNKPPAGVRIEFGGQYASQQAAFQALMVVLGLATACVIAVMVIQFQSFVEPFVVVLAAPFSFAGAMLLLLLTGTPLNVSSFMGLILLVGLIVKNGIILLDFTRRRMLDAGLTLEVAIQEAARIRLRPILMTTLCTLVGLLPLALAIGAGSEMQRPLAIAVIGGLALSTPITLYLVPTVLLAIRGRNFRLSHQL
ncbi:MAG: efflux RND transporter permease subunit [Gemmatimonadaceae bacterium]|nr:efflux RND transporter permease subunit [Gemmatimonadaceae bacterium]